MRSAIFAIIITVLVVLAGCSKSGNTPPLPDQMSDLPEVAVSQLPDGYQVMSSGVMNLENGTTSPDDRTVSPYYDVTSFLGSNFSYTIDSIIPPDVLSITLTINNTSSLTVYDVCVVFNYLYGKEVLNPDSYTNVFRPGLMLPFIAFRKEDPDRAFPPGTDTEQLRLKYPSGAGASVKYYIVASVGGNAGGPYEIRDWNVSGELTPSGGSADLSVRVLDHQNDVSMVAAYTEILNGDWTYFSQSADPEIWTATISNTENAPVGEYSIPIKTHSPSAPYYSTWNTFMIEVSSDQGGISQLAYLPKPATYDQWYDIGVKLDGPLYIVADVQATQNTGTARTCVRFDPDFTKYTVLNAGDPGGMNNPEPGSWTDCELTDPFDRVDVTDAGYIVNNTIGSTVCFWQDNGTTATNIAGGEWRLMCGICPIVVDVFQSQSVSCGSVGVGYAQTIGCDTPEWEWDMGFSDADPETYCNWNYVMNILFAEYEGIKSLQGLSKTDNALAFYSSDTEGYLQEVGPLFSSTTGDLNTIGPRHGTIGTGDGQFKCGLDMAIDSEGYILTLEYLGGHDYRFQRFDSQYNHLFTQAWSWEGDPIRMDFDQSDDDLYLITNTGVHRLKVN